MNTVQKFLNATGYSRGYNHPSVSTLKAKMDELNVDEDTKIDIMSFFLYDHESSDHEPVIKHFQDEDNRGDSHDGGIKHFQD